METWPARSAAATPSAVEEGVEVAVCPAAGGRAVEAVDDVVAVERAGVAEAVAAERRRRALRRCRRRR